jgi:hypothetical protein
LAKFSALSLGLVGPDRINFLTWNALWPALLGTDMLATKVACPVCSKKLKTPKPVGVGKHLRCSRCDHPFTLRLQDMLNPTPGDAETPPESLSHPDFLVPEEITGEWDSAAAESPVATLVAAAPAHLPVEPKARPAAASRPAASLPRKGVNWVVPTLIVFVLVVITALAVTLTIYLGGDAGSPGKVPGIGGSDLEGEQPRSFPNPTRPPTPIAEAEIPPLSPLEKLPPVEQERIKKAIERGLAYLRKNQGPDGVWPGGYPIGLAALPGLTLLECGVPSSDPQVQKAAGYVRSAIAKFDRTYELSLTILFLDRLGDPRDEALIQSLALRLIGGQTGAGGWYYTCPVYSPDDERKLLAALNALRPRSNDDLFVPGPDGKKQDWFPQGMDLPISPSAPVDAKKLLAGLPANLQKVPALQIPVPGKPFPTTDQSDNSNTQFAALGLWAAGRHGVPNERALAMLTTRFRLSQGTDGGWNYSNQRGAVNTSAMTGAGLLGLAVGHGLVANHTTVNGADNRADRRAVVDAALEKGLASIARHIGQPITDPGKRPAAAPLNLYFLWTLERVAVLYNLPLIDGKDWYRWGAQQLVETQNAEGFWSIPNGYPGASPVLDTSLGLLFLKRANLAKDLTRKLDYLGRVRTER